MKIKRLIGLVLGLAVITLAACSSGSNNSSSPQAQLSGIASKGPLKNADVKVFAIKNGVVDTSAPIGTGTTDAIGNFNVTLSSAFNGTGAVEVLVTGGTFTDEATGVPGVGLKTELRAMITNVSAGAAKVVAVTPLTELASKKAETTAAGLSSGLTSTAIDDSNKSISDTFQIGDDITTTLPKSDGSVTEKKHSTACAAISQIVNGRKHTGESTDDALTRVMGELETEIETHGGLSTSTETEIHSAETEVETHNGTGGGSGGGGGGGGGGGDVTSQTTTTTTGK
jgi:hypothetical protein